jgi:hypothetical protein
MDDPRGKRVFGPLLQQMLIQAQAVFGGDEDSAIGLGAQDFLMDLPLPGALNFLGTAQTTSPEEMVDGLLAKLHGE